MIKQQKAQIRRIGTVNLEADQEYREVKDRYDNLNIQVKDLTAALSDIEEMIKELDVVMKAEFWRHSKQSVPNLQKCSPDCSMVALPD